MIFRVILLLALVLGGAGCAGFPSGGGEPFGNRPVEPESDNLTTPTASPPLLYPSGRVPGIFLTQVEGMSPSLPGLIDITAVTPVDNTLYGDSTFIKGSPELQKALNDHGLVMVTGKVVTTSPDGKRVMLDNIASYRDSTAHGFQLALPDRLFFLDAEGQRTLVPLVLEITDLDLDGDGQAERLGKYAGAVQWKVPGTLPLTEEYNRLIAVSALAGSSISFEEQVFPVGSLLAVVLESNEQGDYTILSALPILFPPESNLQATRQNGLLLLEAINPFTRQVEFSYTLAYNPGSVGLPAKYARLQEILPGYEFRMINLDGRTWVWGVNDQDQSIRFPEDVQVVENRVVGYSERGGAIWEFVIENDNGTLEIKATRLSGVNWTTLTPLTSPP